MRERRLQIAVYLRAVVVVAGIRLVDRPRIASEIEVIVQNAPHVRVLPREPAPRSGERVLNELGLQGFLGLWDVDNGIVPLLVDEPLPAEIPATGLYGFIEFVGDLGRDGQLLGLCPVVVHCLAHGHRAVCRDDDKVAADLEQTPMPDRLPDLEDADQREIRRRICSAVNRRFAIIGDDDQKIVHP